MRIVIDMQGAQSTGSRNRGIGRYTLSLAQAIVRNGGAHEVFLALNGLFPDTIETIRSAFYGLLPQENIRVWQAPGPVNSLNDANVWRRRTAELVREAFLAGLNPDIVLISSLSEGLLDDAVTSVGTLSRTVPTAVILYDLIPMIHHRIYQENPVVEAWCENKYDHLRRADLLLAISESSRQEGIRYLGFPVDKCVNISTAAEPQFRPQQVDTSREQDVRQRYGLHSPFVMYTGGIDYRKNIEGLIRAYARLPKQLRVNHQLAIVCSIQPPSRIVLETLAKEQGLKADELVLTGFVPEDDLISLYNLCKAFVFPSWHEGFGLPALEAMSCGRAVIGANTSSLPEVIGRDDALFDPKSDTSITEKLVQVLTDDSFRAELEQHGLEQAKRFSWDTSAKRAIAAVEARHVKTVSQPLANDITACRPKLAYLSPLPPERSGISDYSAELLPELSRHYDIDVIVVQDSVTTPWVKANCHLRSVEWFMAHADCYDRVLYHFGNSQFHQHMFNLLEKVPGIVVLHDFFLSGVAAYMEASCYQPGAWTEALYQNHGYAAVQQRFQSSNTADVIWRYPCNLGVLQNSLGVVVHSENSRRLAAQWFGEGAANDWRVVPLLRAPAADLDKNKARRLLKLNNDDFVVCSFGFISAPKLNHRLLEAWLASDLARSKHGVLIFVGINPGDYYGAELVAVINRNGLGNRIRITGWTDVDTFRNYLSAADVGVQLRTLSRGETSAAVLDCMNYGLPTIVNGNGSMADLPDDGVWKLPDEFDDVELVGALETLWRDASLRQQLGARAREIISTLHAPRTCADQYAQAIETMYRGALTGVSSLTHALAAVEPVPVSPEAWISLAEAVALSIPPRLVHRQLLVDISELVQRDSKSDIQSSILAELLASPPVGYRVEPIYATLDQGYRYARRFTLNLLDCPEALLPDDSIEFWAGDLFLGLDFQPQVAPARQILYQQLHNHGVQVQFVLYDIFSCAQPKISPEDAEKGYHAWLKVVAENDGVICISKAVAWEFAAWLKTNEPVRKRPFKIDWFNFGADINASLHSKGMPENAEIVLMNLASRPSFLMVGTLASCRGYIQTLIAFEKLWADGVEINLIIVGKQGWMTESLGEKLRHHPELNKRLLWVDGIGDEYLKKIYTASICLIASSEGECFGLSLIEAMQYKLPVIARDIPVFREVAGEYAFYLSGLDTQTLADAVERWLALKAEGKVPLPVDMHWLAWRQSEKQLLSPLLQTHQTHSYSSSVKSDN